jgi:hypothetical protein
MERSTWGIDGTIENVFSGVDSCCRRCGSALIGASLVYSAQSLSIVSLIVLIISAIVAAYSVASTAIIIAISGGTALLLSGVIGLIGMSFLAKAVD